MKANWKMLAVLPAFLLMQGCVVVVGTDAEDGMYMASRDYDINGVQHDGDRLSKKVASAIAGDEDLVAEEIRVSSEDGIVVLKGRVGTVALLEKALAKAKAVEGVDRVVSKMTVDAG